MQTIQSLFDQMPRAGQLQWIGVRPARGEPMRVLDRVVVNVQTGLDCDRYKGRSGTRQVTLIQAEHLPVIAALQACESIAPAILRRNLVISGINLLALKNRVFAIGDVHLQGTGLCHPCSAMERALGPGGYNAMRGHGGITARVVLGGEIRCADRVCLVDEGP